MPLLLVAAVVGGIACGAYLKRRRPALYAVLSSDLERFDALPDRSGSTPVNG